MNVKPYRPILAVVVPCYNEEEVLRETAQRLGAILERLARDDMISEKSFVLFVDDGSTDRTWEIIDSLAKTDNRIRGIKLSSNRGHQIALVAGMEYVLSMCDCAVTIDADLQDDVNAIIEMVDKYRAGYEIVYGVRSSRHADTFFKRVSAEFFYRFMNILGARVIFNHADYRLLSKRALAFLSQFGERNLFLRGLIPLIGLKSACVYYERAERFAGQSKYSLRKMMGFAWDGITSFSIVPLRLISLIGFLVFIFSAVMSFYVLIVKLFTDKTVPGWASTVLPIYFIGGIQLLSLGVIGEYVGKIYSETKRRPRYFIEKESPESKAY